MRVCVYVCACVRVCVYPEKLTAITEVSCYVAFWSGEVNTIDPLVDLLHLFVLHLDRCDQC